jgi:hypothetical protein
MFPEMACLRLLPARARASALCVMGGRQRFLGDAFSYTHMGSTPCITINGLARAGDSAAN